MKSLYIKYFKQLIDITLSIMLIILFIPIYLIVLTFLWISLKGNPFFVQERTGRNGKIFKIIKFRSMNNDLDSNGQLKADKDRLTRAGKIVRNLSLDELPQLLNIIKGEMSLIGPRPLLKEYLELYSDRQNLRHNVLPGITGWAQVNGRNSISWDDKFELDVYYVENISFLLDLKIIILTVKKVFMRDGVSAENHVTMTRFTGPTKSEKL